MRQYNGLISFMLDLGTAIQDYLPEDQRTNPMSLIEFLEEWTGKKSYYEMGFLRSDIRSYLRKHARGNYSIDELFFYYDIGFVEERLGCENQELLAEILGMLDVHSAERRNKTLKQYLGWMGYR